MGIRHDVDIGNEKQDAIIQDNSRAISCNADRLTVIESEARGKHSQIALIFSVVAAVSGIGAVIVTMI